jgi:hypothetical protein
MTRGLHSWGRFPVVGGGEGVLQVFAAGEGGRFILLARGEAVA